MFKWEELRENVSTLFRTWQGCELYLPSLSYVLHLISCVQIRKFIFLAFWQSDCLDTKTVI